MELTESQTDLLGAIAAAVGALAAIAGVVYSIARARAHIGYVERLAAIGRDLPDGSMAQVEVTRLATKGALDLVYRSQVSRRRVMFMLALALFATAFVIYAFGWVRLIVADDGGAFVPYTVLALVAWISAIGLSSWREHLVNTAKAKARVEMEKNYQMTTEEEQRRVRNIRAAETRAVRRLIAALNTAAGNSEPPGDVQGAARKSKASR